MPIQIRDDEAINAQCVIQDITCILTSARLMVMTPTQEESYPINEIAAIDVYDNNEKYSADRKREKKKRVLLAISCCVLFNTLALN